MEKESEEKVLTEKELVLLPEERKDANFLIPNLNFPNLEKGCKDPPLYAIRKFLSDEECQNLIDSASNSLERSTVVEKDKPISESRTSSSHYPGKYTVMWLCERVSELLNVPIDQMESPQITKYIKGQFFREHYDHINITTEEGKNHLLRGGQRICTVLIYLNEVEAGGGTCFKKLGFKVKPKTGSALIFFPSTIDGKYDPLTLHEAEEIEEGEKWVCQVWIRQTGVKLDDLIF
jgi:prolyl 4-hydroxylase